MSVGKYAFDECTSITDVYYDGTEDEWNAIDIATHNDPILHATIHFNGEPSTVPVTGIALDKTEYTLPLGETVTLKATIEPEDATNKNVTWESSDTSIADVDSTGKVTAEGAGEAIVKVITEDGNFEATCVITVTSSEIHEHDLVETEAVEPTCEDAGSTEYWTCSICNKHFSDENGQIEIEDGSWVIPALDHLWDGGEITTEPTCIDEGEVTFRCMRCGETKTEAIEAAGHTWDAEFTIDEEPTCTKDGSKSKHCANCDEKTEITAIPAAGHTFGEWEEVTSSTCENSGVQQHSCEICGFTESEGLDPSGHTWEEEYTVDVPPTCTEDGSQSIHCMYCDAVTDSEVIPATGHSYGEWEIIKEPTCIDAGEKARRCSGCDDMITEELPALGHSWNEEPTVDKEPTCIDDGSQSVHCARCDETKDAEVIPASGTHSWDAGKITKATATTAGKKVYTCTVCGETKTEAIPKVTAPSGKVTILNTLANSAKKTNDVIWDKSKVKGATGYIIEWRARGASKWASRKVGNVTRGVTSGLTIGNLYEIRVIPYKPATATTAEVKGTPSDIVYRYFFTTQKIRLASNSKGTFTMSWAKDPKATSYQVLYTTNSNGSGAAQNIKTAGASATSITVKDIKVNGKVQKLKSGTTYYVQVREVRTVGGKNYIGNISIPVAVKVK